MFRRIHRSVIVSAVLAAAGTAGATTTRDPSVDPSLAACVRVVAQETAARRIEVVRRTDRFGLGNAEYWLNAEVEPASKDECKRGGWKDFTLLHFKNQGDCVSYVATHSRNGAATKK